MVIVRRSVKDTRCDTADLISMISDFDTFQFFMARQIENDMWRSSISDECIKCSVAIRDSLGESGSDKKYFHLIKKGALDTVVSLDEWIYENKRGLSEDIKLNIIQKHMLHFDKLSHDQIERLLEAGREEIDKEYMCSIILHFMDKIDSDGFKSLQSKKYSLIGLDDINYNLEKARTLVVTDWSQEFDNYYNKKRLLAWKDDIEKFFGKKPVLPF